MAQISESYLSKPFTLGPSAAWELIYDIVGEPVVDGDDTAVYELMSTTVPSIYQGLILDSIDCEPAGAGVWKGHAKYIRLENNNEYTFDTSGGNQKITQSLNTTIYDFVTSLDPYGYDDYGDEVGTGPDFAGAIGVDGDNVEGVDIVVPQYEFSETHLIADALVTGTYKQTLRNLTGRICNAPFKDFDTGEALFMGASGNKRGDTQWSITYRFASSQNRTGLSVGGITGIDKGGWDYLWVRYDDFEDETAFSLVKRPVAVYVETVYYSGDFSTMGIGT